VRRCRRQCLGCGADVPATLIGLRSAPESPVTAEINVVDLATPSCSSTHPSHPHLRHPPIDAMASRRLALNLQQSMRSRAAITAVKARQSPLTRGLATPVQHGSKTESTTLKNGFTVRWPPEDPAGLQLTPPRRSLPSTPRGPRRRQSAYGSMRAAAPRRTGPTAPRTSSSTWPSRYGATASERVGS
jgi:hypothetical protein